MFQTFYFQVSSSEFGSLQSVELLQNGENIPVTNCNREQFVSLYVDYLLVKSVEKQFSAFSRGFHKVGMSCLEITACESLFPANGIVSDFMYIKNKLTDDHLVCANIF